MAFLLLGGVGRNPPIVHPSLRTGGPSWRSIRTKLNALLGRAVVDIGANFHAALVITGDKLGLFRAMRELGPTTPADLAKRTNTHERYIREWLSAMAAGGYVTYERATSEFSLSEEQAVALLDADLPGRVPARAVHREVGAADHRSVPDRQGDGLARARSGAVRGDRAVLPAGLCGQPRPDVDPGARGRPGQARRRVAGWPTWAAATAPRRSSWRRRSPSRASWASTTTRARSRSRARWRSVKGRRGSRRSRASRPSWRRAAGSPTWAAATAPRRSSWRRRSRVALRGLRLPRGLDRVGARGREA